MKNDVIKKLKPDPVRWGKHFCIARIEDGMLTEIEGKWVRGEYCINLIHQPSYIQTYREHGFEGTADEWYSAVKLLYGQVASMMSIETVSQTELIINV